MSQEQAKFLGVILGLSLLMGCSSAGGGSRSTPPAPTATLTATPSTIIAGQGNSTLAFTSTNADSGVIDNGVGPVGLNSQVNVTPALTTTYTYTATGPGGSATAQATVTVTPAGPAPTVTLTANPTSIFAGQGLSLTWQSTNAANVLIDNNVGPVSPASGGTATLPPSLLPTKTTTYTATAIGANNQQASATATVTVAALTSFDGMLPDSTNAANTDIDPNGAVGTKQFMEYVNAEYQAFDKTTFQPVFSTAAGMSGLPIGTPWTTPLNGAPLPECETTGIALDAVIIFDRIASRWVIAGKAIRAGGVEQYYFCIAVSNTDDAASPSFGWYAYSLFLDPILGKNPGGKYYLPDWPKVGTWPDAYYATMDMLYDNTNSVESGVAVCALDRNNMLNGALLNPAQCFTDTSLLSNGIYLGHSLIPADFDGRTPPPSGRDEFLVSIQNPVNDSVTTTSSTFNLWDFHVDWTNPLHTTHSLSSIPVTAYTPGCYLFVPNEPAITFCVLEPPADGGGQHIDSVGDRFMPRFDYRNFGAYESFLISNTLQTATNSQNPFQTGVNWYELRGSGTPSVYQSGIINPDDRFFRFLPSIAQDKTGNAAVGYSVSNNVYDPEISFSYWNLATLNAPTTEVPIFAGAGEEITPITGTGKWGTYSSITVDPSDDCTFWYVNEYWPNNTAWATRIAFFKVPSCQ
jgi:hypothetical protein